MSEVQSSDKAADKAYTPRLRADYDNRIAKAMIGAGLLIPDGDGKSAQSLKPPRASRTRLYVVRLDGSEHLEHPGD